MDKIKKIQALEILDSRGNPTISVRLELESGIASCASVPSGASTGAKEALELRDNDPKRYLGKGVQKAVTHIEGPIQKALLGLSTLDQETIDQTMLDLDGSRNKETLGANAILGVSMASARAGAIVKNVPLYRHLSDQKTYSLPCPMMNIINGGAHADNSLDFQEFMIRPKAFSSFKKALQAGAEIFHTLKKLLKERKFSTGVGDEGGFAPNFSSNEEALNYIMEAIKKAGYHPSDQISIALDAAASEFFLENCYIEKKKQEKNEPFISRNYQEMTEYLTTLSLSYPIDSIEDGFAEDDWEGWRYATEKLGKKLQLVGDDIFVTNREILQKGIEKKAGNAILIKLNQIGTLTETLATIALAKEHGYATVISHRSGETCDTFIADLAVATGGQIKTGSLCRSERVAKYNRLLQIEKELEGQGIYKDTNLFSSTN